MNIPLFLPFLAVFLFQGTTQYENRRQDPYDLHSWYVDMFAVYSEPRVRELMSPSVSVTFCNGTMDIEGFVKYIKDVVTTMHIYYGFNINQDDQIQPDINTWIYIVSMEGHYSKEWNGVAVPDRSYNVTATRKSDGKFSIDTMKDLNCTTSN